MHEWSWETDRKTLDCIHFGAVELRAEDPVRLHPRRRADIFDLALDGKTARIESIEQDLEGRVYLAVTIDDDPGRDFGAMRQAGHRFFFALEEVEPLDDQPGRTP